MLIPFNPGQIARMDFPPHEVAVLAGPDAIANLELLAEKTLCATIATEDGEILLGIVGAVPLPDATCEVFVVATRTQKKHPRVFAQGVRRAIEIVAPGFAIIQTVGEDTPALARWFTWLGFSLKGDARGMRMLMWEMPGGHA